jgi:hypothetical protein
MTVWRRASVGDDHEGRRGKAQRGLNERLRAAFIAEADQESRRTHLSIGSKFRIDVSSERDRSSTTTSLASGPRRSTGSTPSPS